MAYSKRTVSIAIASAIALVFIGVAFLISGPLPFHIGIANAESTHDLLVAYAAKDSDNDGLPDWEEALYGTDPNNPHSISPTLTDGQEVAQGLIKPKFGIATATSTSDTTDIPGPTVASSTLTDQFARALFGNYLSTHGDTTPTPDDIATFVEQGVSQLEASNVTPDAFNAGEVKVSGEGPTALAAYAVSVEQVFDAHPITESESEIEYLDDATTKNDPTALKKIAQIGAYYTAVGQGVIKVPAPKELAAAHLEFANSLMRLGSVITDLSLYNSDPLRTFLALDQYQNAAGQMFQALANLNASYTAEGVVINKGTPGSHFFATMMLGSVTTPTP